MSFVAVGETLKLRKAGHIYRAPLWGWCDETHWNDVSSVQAGARPKMEQLNEQEVIYFSHSGEALLKVVTLSPDGKDWLCLYTKSGSKRLRTYSKPARMFVLPVLGFVAAVLNAVVRWVGWTPKEES